VEQHYNGKLQHWYTVNPQPRKIEDFRKVIADSYSNSAVFMNAIRITRFNDGGVLVLKNLLFIEISGSQTFTIKLTRNELPGFVEKRLGIPANLVGTALASVKDLKDFYD
jgi:arylamine N-acetyltransferase